MLRRPGPASGRRAGPARRAEGDALQVGAVLHPADPARPWVAGIEVVEPVHVRQQDQRAGPDHVRDQGGQPVVVAKPDLVGGDRVVLVHHGQDAQFEQPVQGPLRVAVVRAAHQVVRGQQDLPGLHLVPGERGRVHGDKQALADARGRLLGGQVPGPAGQPKRRQARRDRPGGDQHHLGTRAHLVGEHPGQRRDPALVDPAVGGGERGRADLDHDPAGGGDVGPVVLAGVLRWGVPGHQGSRSSVPRGPNPCGEPAGTSGSQSNTTASSGSPMATSAPAWAPASASACSTPIRASRSPR